MRAWLDVAGWIRRSLACDCFFFVLFPAASEVLSANSVVHLSFLAALSVVFNRTCLVQNSLM